MSMTQNSKRALGTLAALTALMVSSAVFAADAVETPGMKVVKDALTGELRAPTTDELKSTQMRAKSRSVSKSVGMVTGSDAPQAVVRANGSVMLELTEDSMVYSVAKRNADGSMEMECVHGADAAHDAVHHAHSHTTKQAKKEQKNDK